MGGDAPRHDLRMMQRMHDVVPQRHQRHAAAHHHAGPEDADRERARSAKGGGGAAAAGWKGAVARAVLCSLHHQGQGVEEVEKRIGQRRPGLDGQQKHDRRRQRRQSGADQQRPRPCLWETLRPMSQSTPADDLDLRRRFLAGPRAKVSKRGNSFMAASPKACRRRFLARWAWTLTIVCVQPHHWAISATEHPSRYISVKTSRSRGASWAKTA